MTVLIEPLVGGQRIASRSGITDGVGFTAEGPAAVVVERLRLRDQLKRPRIVSIRFIGSRAAQVVERRFLMDVICAVAVGILLRRHLIGVSKSAFGVAFYAPNA